MWKFKHLLLFVLLNYCALSPASANSEDMGTEEEATPEPETKAGSGKNHDQEFAKEAADKINELRALHGAPKLVLDNALAESAQNHANKIALSGNLVISCTSCSYGENLAMGPPNKKIVVEVKNCIQRWYNMSATYDFKTGKGKTNKTNAGSFTQLVWKNSKKVGIGAAKSAKNNYIYVVVQFHPPGNMAGNYKLNVKPLVKSDSGAESGSEQPTDSTDDASAGTSGKKPHSFADAASEDGDADAAAPAPMKKGATEKLSKTTGKKGYQNQVLEFINAFRTKHHAPPLTLDQSLTAIAQGGADKAAKSGKLGYTCEGDGCKYGENQGSAVPNPDMAEGVNAAVQDWYDEEPNYDYKKGTEKAGKEFPGSFTALVWKGSTKVGIGAATKGANGQIYVVVTFQPPGNLENQYIKNVLKP